MSLFPQDPTWLVRGEEREWAVRSLRSYYREYSGGWFERLCDRAHPFTFQAGDIVAVSTLGVVVPPETSIWLLDGAGRDATASLLSAIPHGVTIWEAEETDLGPASAAQALWDLLDRRPGIGPVIAGKLMAAKRPDLIPIWDQWVNTALGPVESFWMTMRELLARAALRADIAGIRDEADLPCTPSLLRTLDVIVWMRRFGHKNSSDVDLRNRDFSGESAGTAEPDGDQRLIPGRPQPVVKFPFSIGRSFLARGEITIPVQFNPIFDERLRGRGPSWTVGIESALDRTVGSLRRGHTGGNRYYQIRVPPSAVSELVGAARLGDVLTIEVELSPSLRIGIVPSAKSTSR